MASNLFLFGTLRHAPLLEAVAGTLPPLLPAGREGFRIAPSGEGDWPVLVQEPGATAHGLLIRDILPDMRDRIAHYESAFDMHLRECQVEVNGQVVPAEVFVPANPSSVLSGHWNLDAWVANRAPADILAAQEIMGLWGRYEGDELRFRVSQIEARAYARLRARDQAVPHRVGTGPHDPQVELLSRQDEHAGYFFTRTYQLRHRTFSGGMSPEVRREVFLAPDAAIVLPYDPVRDRVLLVEQFRMGPFARGEDLPWMLEPVAGRIDPGEDPETCARREAKEEAGLDLTRLLHIASCYPTPGCVSEYFHCYLGICDLPDRAPGTFGLEEEAEDIRTHVLSFDDAMELISSGEARNAPLILSLIWLSGKRSQLRGAA
ncbi:NUDIX domain-containing protein [Pseudooceanicola sp. HF7]|uniref:NUDIX domain-containing protein n=1 Tax=Pseudooceanicola sp. HF7 TaxID=2721560 RepID=UPI00143147A6|nr:NUDIX domain-containing protein [Pseudooceanicola sp. HF7]NIZ08680.1 NUDIX domain-containing protein [Pseudooceanicola sp. HF7]